MKGWNPYQQRSPITCDCGVAITPIMALPARAAPAWVTPPQLSNTGSMSTPGAGALAVTAAAAAAGAAAASDAQASWAQVNRKFGGSKSIHSPTNILRKGFRKSNPAVVPHSSYVLVMNTFLDRFCHCTAGCHEISWLVLNKTGF